MGAGAKRLALQHVVRRKPVGAGSPAQSSDQAQKRRKTATGSTEGTNSQDATFEGTGPEGNEQSTDQAAHNRTSPGGNRAQRIAAAVQVNGAGSQQGGSSRPEQMADGGGYDSTGLTALVGDYGSDSDDS